MNNKIKTLEIDVNDEYGFKFDLVKEDSEHLSYSFEEVNDEPTGSESSGFVQVSIAEIAEKGVVDAILNNMKDYLTH